MQSFTDPDFKKETKMKTAAPFPLNTDDLLSVRQLGAKGDGKTDDTAAIQTAIDQVAATSGGGVWVPPGVYAVGTLRIPSYVGLFATPTWSYHQNGGTQLLLNDPDAHCLLDLTGSYGARVSGLGLGGANLGSGVHGIFLDGSKHTQEDTLFIEHCRIAQFTGDGIHLDHVWGFTVRDCMVIFNDGDGLSFTHWDGWVHDCIFNNNKGWGIHGRPWNGSVTVVDNRIEWNWQGGVLIDRGNHFNINNNYIDRSGGPGIRIHCNAEEDREYGRTGTHTITGNLIYRSGARVEPESPDSAHIHLDYQAGLTVTGNVMTTGRNDSGKGTLSPAYGIRYSNLRCAIIKDNTLYHGATHGLVVDEGDNDESCIVRDNPGLLTPPVKED